MKIFVSGATGVIGKRAVPLLLNSGHQVTAVARSPEKAEQLQKLGAEAKQVSLFDVEAIKKAVQGHDAIINVATHIPPSTRAFFPSAWKENDRIRKFGSANLVDAAIFNGVKVFVQESFAPMYRDHGDDWIDENWDVKPVRYNLTTLDAEQSVQRFIQSGGRGIALRFSYFYGPDPGGATMDIIRFLKKGWVALPGSPEAFISSISHDDVAAAVVNALNIESGIYNVSDDEPLRRREFFNSLADVLGVHHPKFLPRWISKLMGSTAELLSRSLRISNQKFRNASGWQPKFPSVREGWRA
ncbi:MAG TPA: NAD(P)-dependent oxidoreductase, partial [Acidobacteriota bacterium]